MFLSFQFAKALSNISLGKLSQNPQRTSVTFAHCWQDISRIKFSSDKVLTQVFPISESIAEVKYEPKEERAGFAKNVQPGEIYSNEFIIRSRFILLNFIHSGVRLRDLVWKVEARQGPPPIDAERRPHLLRRHR